MKKLFLILLLVGITVPNLYAQHASKDYEILNKLFLFMVRDSSRLVFQSKFNLDESITDDLGDDLKEMRDSLNLEDEFGHYTKKKIVAVMEKWNWSKKKIVYKYVEAKKPKGKLVFSISPPLYSKSGKYFFVVADYPLYTNCSIYEILESGSLKFRMKSNVCLKVPSFR